MPTLVLDHGEWYYDDQARLGSPGAFGSVYAGVGPGEVPIAVKILDLNAPGPIDREVLFADLLRGHSFEHIIPVFDVGFDPALRRYAIVMARADKNLQEEINSIAPLEERHAVAILHQIALGLSEVRYLVHRDLKPLNILHHDGQWKISDFGIARLVEAATSKDTMKEFCSHHYAAPEQWSMERSTHATDLYALGCIGYALMAGRPPFLGSRDELHYQHRYVKPDIPSSVSPAFKVLLSMLLRKEQASRPDRDRVLVWLERSSAQTAGSDQLALVAAEQAFKDLAQEVAQQRESADAEARRGLATYGCQLLEQLRDDLYHEILEHAPNAEVKPMGMQIDSGSALAWKAVNLGSAHLSMRIEQSLVTDVEVVRPGGEIVDLSGAWDVLSTAEITVVQKTVENKAYQEFLVFRNDLADGEYRWRAHRLVAIRLKGRELRRSRLSLESQPIDDENFIAFTARWLDLFAAAIRGRLGQADQTDPTGS